jgi:xylulokinase
MGGAIQALWCLLRNLLGKGAKKITIETLTDEHVVLEGGVTVMPDKKDVTAYNKAYDVYSRYLGALSPLYK